MEALDPYAPIRPDQEQAIRALLQERPGLLPRRRREEVLRGLPAMSCGHAAWLLESLECQARGEAPPPKPTLDMEPAPPVDRAATRARINEPRQRLDAAFAGRAMQPVGLVRRSHFAGMNGNPESTNA